MKEAVDHNIAKQRLCIWINVFLQTLLVTNGAINVDSVPHLCDTGRYNGQVAAYLYIWHTNMLGRHRRSHANIKKLFVYSKFYFNFCIRLAMPIISSQRWI